MSPSRVCMSPALAEAVTCQISLILLLVLRSSMAAGVAPTLTFIPPTLNEFSSYAITCTTTGNNLGAGDSIALVPVPPGGANPPSGATAQPPPPANFTYQVGSGSVTFGPASTLQGRTTFNESSSMTSLTVAVSAGYGGDSGSYMCIVILNGTNSSSISLQSSPQPLTVTPCTTQQIAPNAVDTCSSGVVAGLLCTVGCTSLINGTFPTLSPNPDGSQPVAATVTNDSNSITYNVTAAVGVTYYCYVRTTNCASRVVLPIVVSGSATNSSSSNGKCQGKGCPLPPWAIAVIVIGCIIFLVLLVLLVLFILWKLNRDSTEDAERNGAGGHPMSTTGGADNRAFNGNKSAGVKSEEREGGMKRGGGGGGVGGGKPDPYNFPDASKRNRQLPPLSPSAPAETEGKPKKKRRSSVDENQSPERKGTRGVEGGKDGRGGDKGGVEEGRRKHLDYLPPLEQAKNKASGRARDDRGMDDPEYDDDYESSSRRNQGERAPRRSMEQPAPPSENGRGRKPRKDDEDYDY